ncbi:hypothetical protein [Pseudonocardia sp. HH130630-07]|uniref:hypothetical protein n=1 Tax=Pseudonocardia sp. HH130630-07 TaxID=1690815 RepID=UPI0012EA934C|nr:hypothetical protein [Pseudonocardia sp. HH130630-07]
MPPAPGVAGTARLRLPGIDVATRLGGRVRAVVTHRTAAVAVGATLALAVGAVAATAGGSEPEPGPAAAEAPLPVPPDLVAGSVPADPAVFGVPAGGGTAFVSPSGNIACRIDASGARCDVGNRQWTADAPQGCDEPGLAVGGAPGSRATCDGDAAPADGSELGYDTHLTRGAVTCVSRRTGVECRDAGSGHGFTAARASHRLY